MNQREFLALKNRRRFLSEVGGGIGPLQVDEVIGVILCDDREVPVPSFDDYRAEYEREVAQPRGLVDHQPGRVGIGCGLEHRHGI